MKVSFRLAVFLTLLFCSAILISPAYADNNPYMPGGRTGPGVMFNPVPDLQQQQALQALLTQDGSGGTPSPPAPQPGASSAPPNAEIQELRTQQASDASAIAREATDREIQIKALKDAFNAQIQDMQHKIDKLQTEVDDTRYKNRL